MDLSILGKMEGHALRSFMALSGKKKNEVCVPTWAKKERKEKGP